MLSSLGEANLSTFFILHSACARIPIISGHPELDSGL